jgi:hypothetical protein
MSNNNEDPHCCQQMSMHLSEKEVAIVYNQRFREYGIRILDGGNALQRISFCPWCGSKLPASLRDLWFARLDSLGLEPDDPRVPEEMKTDAWWRDIGKMGR